MQAHDHREVETYCYSNSPFVDDVTAKLRQASEHWRDITWLSDDDAAKLIGEDGIDILVDLSGHTANNRLPLFARRPAPIQVTWLGYWGTSGLAAMDYILSDDVTIPPGEERYYSEQVLHLPGGRFCYAPPDYAPGPAEPPCLRNGFVTFGSFNNISKVGPDVVALWARALRAVAGSRFLLKWRSLGEERSIA